MQLANSILSVHFTRYLCGKLVAYGRMKSRALIKAGKSIPSAFEKSLISNYTSYSCSARFSETVGNMEADPYFSESIAAQALLTLGCFSSGKDEASLRFSGFSCSASSSASAATAESSDDRIRRDPLTLLAMAAYYVQKNAKATKGRRSTTYKISANPGTSSEREEVSAQSTTSTTASRSSNHSKVIVKSGWTSKRVMFVGGRKITETSLRRRASAILQLLSRGCSSEIRIRRELGDSPDTSKALRLLLKMDEVKRSGSGGRRDPFLYEVAGSRSDVDSA